MTVEQQSQQTPSAPAVQADEAPKIPGFPEAPKMPEHLAGLSDVQYDPSRDPRRLADLPTVSEQSGQAVPQAPVQDGSPPDAPVPSHRLREEREKREDAEKRYQELQQQQQRIQDRFQILQEQIQAGQRQQLEAVNDKPLPNPDEDLQAYVLAVQERYEERDRKRDEELGQLRQRDEHSQLVQGVYNRARADEAAFMTQAPDFKQAYSWYRNQQLAELTSMGVDPALAAQEIDNKELQITAYAQQNGKNSAESFYRAAVARGWQPPQQRTQQAVDQTYQQMQSPADVTPIAQHPGYATNQQQPIQPQAAPQQQYQPHGQSLQNMHQGMLHSRSLDEAPPSQTGVPLDLERIANMSDAEFMAVADRVPAMMRSQMG